MDARIDEEPLAARYTRSACLSGLRSQPEHFSQPHLQRLLVRTPARARPAALCAAEVFPEPRLAPELSCCWQDAQGPSRSAKPPPQNALDQKLSCCLQDRGSKK